MICSVCAHGDVLHLNSICPARWKYFVFQKSCWFQRPFYNIAGLKRLGLYHLALIRTVWQLTAFKRQKANTWGIWANISLHAPLLLNAVFSSGHGDNSNFDHKKRFFLQLAWKPRELPLVIMSSLPGRQFLLAYKPASIGARQQSPQLFNS